MMKAAEREAFPSPGRDPPVRTLTGEPVGVLLFTFLSINDVLQCLSYRSLSPLLQGFCSAFLSKASSLLAGRAVGSEHRTPAAPAGPRERSAGGGASGCPGAATQAVAKGMVLPQASF